MKHLLRKKQALSLKTSEIQCKANKPLLRRLAVFDIDGTIFRSSLIVELVNGCVAAGIFPKSASKEMEADYLAWINRRGSYENYIWKVVRIHQHYIKGVSVSVIEPVVKEIISWQKDRVYCYTRDLIDALRGKYYLLAISGSPSYIVSHFAASLGFNDFRAREFSIENGVFNGKCPNDDYMRHKGKVLRDFIASSGIQFDLKRSLAVGDTDRDIPMLKIVGHPIAFNPNKTLAAYAKRNGWKIVVERKDVIYNVRQFSFL
jgi:HAD superfamily hydrolase (TIGR01490 family)